MSSKFGAHGHKTRFKTKHFVRQADSTACGFACLQMICKYYGKESFPIGQYSSHVTSQEVVSLLSLEHIAQSLGFSTLCARANVSALVEKAQPCILHWNQNHFVVLYKVRGEKCYIADPGKGFVTYSLEEFKSHWASPDLKGNVTGVVMFLEPTKTFYDEIKASTGVTQKNESFRFLLGYVKTYRKTFFWIVLGLIAGSLLQLLLPFLTQSIVDVGIKKRDIGFVWLVLFGQMMLTISRTAIDFVRRWLLLRISLRVNISLVSDFFFKLLKLPMSFFGTKLTGDLMQRVNDHNRVNGFLTQQSLSATFSLFTFVAFGVALLCYNRLVFFLFLVGTVLYGGWTMLFVKRRKVLDYELFEYQAINNSKTYEMLTSMQEIKLQNCGQRRCSEWKDTQTDLLAVQMKTLRLQQLQEAGAIFLNELKNMVITVVAATSVIHGEMTLGMMLAVQYIIGQLNSPVEQLMAFFNSLQDVRLSLERINEIHSLNDEDASAELLCSVVNHEAGISLNHIFFKYDLCAPTNTLEDVTLHIPNGKVTAIVGASGSGKTTLIRLMLSYYPIQNGSITVGGTDLRSLNKTWWRQQCGVVLQDGVIFSDSIARNIAVEDGEMDNERMLCAAEVACIKEEILSLPLQFNTKIGRDGIGLSQGQRQRILIARVVYRNPSFLFLDEATNSLDANNERAIVENLSRFYRGRTVVIVAHRLSTVKSADSIVVLRKGHVVETGTHETLAAKHGVYFHLVKNQLDLE